MRLLFESEIVAHAAFESDLEVIKLSFPKEKVEFQIRNLEVKQGMERPLLKATLIFESETFDTGLPDGRRILKGILGALSYITSVTFEYGRPLKLVDWAEGEIRREYHTYHKFPGHDLPLLALNPELVNSAGSLWLASINDPAGQAVHWFASGVAAKVPEDQFQFFWFCLELLATQKKPTEKVSDKCPVCQEPLYCEECKTHPVHRPFAKQKIQQLIRRYASTDDSRLSEKLFKVRNGLSHGGTPEQIEKSIGDTIANCVTIIAKVSKQAIFEALVPALNELGVADTFHLLDASEYTHSVQVVTMRMRSGSFHAEVEKLLTLGDVSVDLVFPDEERSE